MTEKFFYFVLVLNIGVLSTLLFQNYEEQADEIKLFLIFGAIILFLFGIMLHHKNILDIIILRIIALALVFVLIIFIKKWSWELYPELSLLSIISVSLLILSYIKVFFHLHKNKNNN